MTIQDDRTVVNHKGLVTWRISRWTSTGHGDRVYMYVPSIPARELAGMRIILVSHALSMSPDHHPPTIVIDFCTL